MTIGSPTDSSTDSPLWASSDDESSGDGREESQRSPTQLERPTQSEPPAHVKRYFCLVELPTFLERQKSSGLNHPVESALRIFHSDTVPSSTPSAGITQEKISTLLSDEVGDVLALGKGVYAYHWMPTTTVLTVETAPGCWTPTVLVLVVRNSDKPITPFLEWARGVKEQIVRQWSELEPQLLAVDPHCSTFKGSGSGFPASNPAHIAQDVTLRGRKRRRVRQHRMFGAAKAPAEPLPEINPKQNPTTKEAEALVDSAARGRARRRLRRKHAELGALDQIGLSSLSQTKTTFQTTTAPPDSILPSIKTGWSLMSNGHDLDDTESDALVGNPVTLTIGSAPICFRSGSHVSQHISRLPVLSIRKNSSYKFRRNKPAETIKKSYLLSDDLSTDSAGNSDSTMGPELALVAANRRRRARFKEKAKRNEGSSVVVTNHRDDSPQNEMILEEQAVVAKLEDSTGIVEAQTSLYFSYGYVGSIEVDPSVPELHASFNHPFYWNRLSLLFMGHAGYRTLPYSQGYGVVHFNPKLVRREWRWGYYEVDDISWLKSSTTPRWRAVWRFDNPAGIPDCQCELACSSNIQHNIESCRHLIDDSPYHSTIPTQILHYTSYFAHWPQEFFAYPEAGFFKEASFTNPGKFNDSISPLWDIFQSRSRPDYDYYSFSVDSETDESKPKIWVPVKKFENLDKHKSIEFPLEHGLAHLVGLHTGSSKDIDKGLGWVVRAAEGGSIKARAVARRLFAAYQRDLEKEDEIQYRWLLDGAMAGSIIAIQDLQKFYPDSDESNQVLGRINFSFNINWLGGLTYVEHVLPHFDLSNPASLTTGQPRSRTQSGSSTMPTTAPANVRNDSYPIESIFISTPRPGNSYGAYSWGSLLHMASLFGFKDVIRTLLDAGLDVNLLNSSRKLRTPLLCALRRGHHQIAETLIEGGADCRPLAIWDKAVIGSPSPMHYLVYIKDDIAATKLAGLLVSKGGEVNHMCKATALDASDLWSLEDSYSVTPLRWAVMHGKSALVKKLLQLGARFATIRSPASGDLVPEKRLSLYLETPCTNLKILHMFFKVARRAKYELAPEFSQTPLGLLVSEDDAPERRLRLGFGDPTVVIAALGTLLDLQPGFEEAVLWSVIRHDHVYLLEYLILHRHWHVETRWQGLTCLHTAVLYRRKRIVQFLLSQGARTDVLTLRRGLSCFHLLMLVGGDQHEDEIPIAEMLPTRSIPINARERCDGLTALHLAVRNRKIQFIPVLLGLGADPYMMAQDQLDLLAEGRSGCLAVSQSRLRRITEDVTILGEVLLQYNQDEFYPVSFIEELLRLFLEHARDKPAAGRSHLYIDSAKTTSILHVMALIPFSRPVESFEQAISCLPGASIDLGDVHGATPLHYACMSHQPRNVAGLIELGADPAHKNTVGLTAASALVFSYLILGPLIWGFQETSLGKAGPENKETSKREKRSTQTLQHDTRWNNRFKSRKGNDKKNMTAILDLLGPHGLAVDSCFRKLALAWCPLKSENAELFLRTIPVKLESDERHQQSKIDSAEETGHQPPQNKCSACEQGRTSPDDILENCVPGLALDQSRQYKMHRTVSADFMICRHWEYSWSNTERSQHDYYGHGKSISVPAKLAGGRPVFLSYGP